MARNDSIKKIHSLLLTRRDALRKALAGDLSMLKQLREQTGGDVVDAALDAAQGEISSQLAEVESRELGSIEKALERVKDGSYGKCEICGGKINLTRLKALPYATNCIECQRAGWWGRLRRRLESRIRHQRRGRRDTPRLGNALGLFVSDVKIKRYNSPGVDLSSPAGFLLRHVP